MSVRVPKSSADRRRSRRRRRIDRVAARRRRALAGLVIVVGLLLVASRHAEAPDSFERPSAARESVREVEVRLGRRTQATIRPQKGVDAAERRLRRLLPAQVTARVGTASVTYRLDARRTAVRAAAARRSTVQVVRQPVASQIKAPVVAQKLRNNCETAALSTLLATRGVDIGQLELQDELPRSGPLDPGVSEAGRIWGDPERGYVGRPDGGGVAGGFGVYQRPVAAVARRKGVPLRDMTAEPSAAISDRLRSGRAVMVWIGLSKGPYGAWRTPTGRDVKVNFGEHTVVLNGIRTDGHLRVVNPLEGTSEIWTQARFQTLWKRLGRRALST